MYRYIEDLNNIRNMFSHMEEPYFKQLGYKTASETEVWRPQTEIWETDKNISVSLDLPGINAEDLDVQLEGDQLIVKGERRFSEENANYHRKEKFYGRFYRAFEIPFQVDRDNISASYKSGVLKILIPKSDAVKTKQVKIAVED